MIILILFLVLLLLFPKVVTTFKLLMWTLFQITASILIYGMIPILFGVSVYLKMKG